MFASSFSSDPSKMQLFRIRLINPSKIDSILPPKHVHTAALRGWQPKSLFLCAFLWMHLFWSHGLYGFYYSIMYLQSSAKGHKSPRLLKIAAPCYLICLIIHDPSDFHIFYECLKTESHHHCHLTLHFFFHFSRAVISNHCPMIHSPFTSCSKKRDFCMYASVCERRNCPWPPPSNPWTSTYTPLISPLHLLAIVFLLFPPCHPHPGWLDY